VKWSMPMVLTGWTGWLSVLAMSVLSACSTLSLPSHQDRQTNLQRAKVFLAAGDFPPRKVIST
jgi:hypothetical protein